MWICLNDGFVSVVEDKPKGYLKVRARKRAHLVALLGKQAKIKRTEKADYRFRARVHKETLIPIMTQRILGIDYGNFKDSVADDRLHDLYADYWMLHHRYQIDEKWRNKWRRHAGV